MTINAFKLFILVGLTIFAAFSLSGCMSEEEKARLAKEKETKAKDERAKNLYFAWESELSDNLQAVQTKDSSEKIKSYWAEGEKELTEEKKELKKYVSFKKKFESLEEKANPPTLVRIITNTLACDNIKAFEDLDYEIQKEGIEGAYKKYKYFVNHRICREIKEGEIFKVKDFRKSSFVSKEIIAVKLSETLGYVLFPAFKIKEGKKSQSAEREYKRIQNSIPIYYYRSVRPFLKLSTNNTTRINFIKKIIAYTAKEKGISIEEATKEVLKEQKKYFKQTQQCLGFFDNESCEELDKTALRVAKIASSDVEDYSKIEIPCDFLNVKKCKPMSLK